MTIGFVQLPDFNFRRIQTLDDLADLWLQEETRLWIDLESPSEADLQRLGQILGLDEVALEDCLHGDPQPGVDEFEGYILIVLYGLYGLKEREDLDPHKLVTFCGSRFLVTIQRHPLLSVRQVRARCGRHPESMLKRGVDVVLFEIIDTMVDNYIRVIDRYEDRLEEIEERSFDIDVSEEILEEAAEVRHDLLELRRLAVAQRQLLLPVAKGEYDFISETLSQRFTQVCNHLGQVTDSVDNLRETIVSIRDNYHSALTRRTNEIVKVLTVFAAILLPLTLIAGIYGMNLPVWPPSDQPSSFWLVLTAMAIIVSILLYYFRRRRWL